MGRRRKGRIWLPGEAGDEFLGEDTGGEAGQYVTLAHDFRHIMDPTDLATGPHGFDVPVFLWAGGGSPLIGPSLSVSGAPVSASTPWSTRDGNAAVSEEYDGASGRYTATRLDPGIGDDVVVAIVARAAFLPVFGRLFSTRNFGVTDGVEIIEFNTSRLLFRVTALGVSSSIAIPLGHVSDAGWYTAVFVVDRTADQIYAWTPGGSTSGPLTDGAITGGGIGIGENPDQSSKVSKGTRIFFVAKFIGTGIAQSWVTGSYAKCRALHHRLFGIHPAQGNISTFQRLSASSWQDSRGVWHIASPHCARSGDAQKLHMSPSRTNKAYRNINPQNVTSLTWTGAKAPTVVDDSVALAAQGCDVWGPNTYEYVNDTGATQYIRMSATTGNVNAHSLQCMVRQLVSSGTKLGLYDESAGTFSGSAIHDGYDAITEIDGQVPADTDCTLCLEVPNGVTVRWVTNSMENQPKCFDVIPNWSYIASALLAAEELATPYTAEDAQGSIAIDITPDGYSGGDLPAGAQEMLRNNPASSTWLYHTQFSFFFTDGTTFLNLPSTTPVDGVSVPLRMRWKGNGFSIAAPGKRNDSAYDGSVVGTGPVTIAPSQPIRVGELTIYRNGDG